MKNTKLEQALADVTLGLFIVNDIDFSVFDQLFQEEIASFLECVTDLVDVCQNDLL